MIQRLGLTALNDLPSRRYTRKFSRVMLKLENVGRLVIQLIRRRINAFQIACMSFLASSLAQISSKRALDKF